MTDVWSAIKFGNLQLPHRLAMAPMARFRQTPTPREILVEGADFMRNAEAEGRFDDTLAAINPFLK